MAITYACVKRIQIATMSVFMLLYVTLDANALRKRNNMATHIKIRGERLRVIQA